MIYRDLRPINWCCSLKSALSDAEVNQNKFRKNIKLNSFFFISKVDNLVISKRTYLNIPNYEKPIEFGLMYEFAYPLYGSGLIQLNK